MDGRLKIVFLVIVIALLVNVLWGLYLVLTRSRTPEDFLMPEIEGRIETLSGYWLFQTGDEAVVALMFETKRYAAKGLSIRLDLGDLEMVEATPSSYTVREGRYVWRYDVLGKEEVGRIELKLGIPHTGNTESAEHSISLYYAYTNEPPVLLDNQTILVRGRGE